MRFFSRSLVAGLWWLLPWIAAQAVTFGSYNIRYDNKGDEKNGNGWKQRAPVVEGLIRFHGFDIVGTQEGYVHQIKGLEELLPEHGCTWHGRDDGKEKGEMIAIFYRKSKFQLINEGCFWLSQAPDQPGTGWDAVLPRICGWAKFKELETGKEFYFFSVHFDHRGTQARKESARLLRERIAKVSSKFPVVLTGDFNVDQTSESYRELVESGVLRDCFEAAEFRYAQTGTANKFDPNTRTESRIDHIFVTSQFRVKRYGILTDSYRTAAVEEGAERSANFPGEVTFRKAEARLPSDHFPVLVEAEW